MARTKAARAPQDSRDRILEAALDLFGERGLTGTTVRDIAARAKVNIAAISYHFRGKEQLYRAVAEAVIGRIGGRMRERAAPLLEKPPSEPAAALDALADFVAALVEVIVGPPEMRRVARFIIREQMQPTIAFEILFATMSQLHVVATRLFAIATGLDPDGEEAKLRVFLMIGQVLILRIAEHAVLRRLGRDTYDAAFIAETRRLIAQNVRAMVDAACEART